MMNAYVCFRTHVGILAWHAFRLFTFRPAISQLPKGPRTPTVLAILSGALLALNGHYALAVLTPTLYLVLLLAFKLGQLASALALITITSHALAGAATLALSNAEPRSFAITVETVVSILIVVMWIRGKGG